MRLLIYLLALISGFSAADAARADVAPASSVAQLAVAAAEALAVSESVELTRAAVNDSSEKTLAQPDAAAISLLISTPIDRHDLTRE